MEHPKAICFNKMAQFVYKLIIKPNRRTGSRLLLSMKQDAFDLGNGTLHILQWFSPLALVASLVLLRPKGTTLFFFS